MRLRLKGIISILFVFVLTSGTIALANHSTASRDFTSETQNNNQPKHFSPTNASECTLEKAISKVHLDIEGNQIGYGNTLLTSRSAQSNSLQNHLPTGRTLQENINHLQKTIQRHYLFLFHKSIGLKPSPVCHYYIFALRRILI